MTRYYGAIGYATQTETAPGVWTDVMVERKLYGDVEKVSRQVREGEHLNKDITVQNVLRVVADEYANGHIYAIRYAEFSGAMWTVDDVTVDHPRLILRLGGVYSGPRPEGTTP